MKTVPSPRTGGGSMSVHEHSSHRDRAIHPTINCETPK